MIRCGSSQLNQKLEKMKSTPDLLGDFRNAVAGGENLKDYFLRQKPKEQLNLEDVIKESMIEASNTQDNELHEIDDAAEVLLQASMAGSRYDDEDREADIIRLKRLEAMLNESSKKEDFERIFPDSGIEFAGRINTSGQNMLDNQMIARLVLQSGVTSSCNIPTETCGDGETSKHGTPSQSQMNGKRISINRNNFM